MVHRSGGLRSRAVGRPLQVDLT